MTSLQTELGLVKEKFSLDSQLVGELYRQEADFKSLCSDYFLCTKLLQEYQTELEEKRLIIKEYEAVCRELEQELGGWLIRTQLSRR
jgi:hypothetical protein